MEALKFVRAHVHDRTPAAAESGQLWVVVGRLRPPLSIARQR